MKPRQYIYFCCVLAGLTGLAACAAEITPCPDEVAAPRGDFRASPRTGPAPLSVSFVDQSWEGRAPITQREWDFGDNETSTETNPTHTYTQPGTYDVRLKVTSEVGTETGWQGSYIHVLPEGQAPELPPSTSKNLLLTPTGQGSRFTVSHPREPQACMTFWGPETITFPNLYQGENVLASGSIAWKTDKKNGALFYKLKRPQATLEVRFVPGPVSVECIYTITPHVEPKEVPPDVFVNGCLSMRGGLFEGSYTDICNRVWFLSSEGWVSVGSCPESGVRNTMLFEGSPPAEQDLESATCTINSPRAAAPLVACTSRDGEWVAAVAGESPDSLLFCNLLPLFRCIHASPSKVMARNGPTTVSATLFLLHGSLDDLKAAYEKR